jgi:uncharacterized protein
MSQGNVDALRPVYDQWAEGNFGPQFDVYAPDMQWGYSSEFPESGMAVEIGQKSGRLREFLSPWELWRCEAEEYIDAGDHVVVFTRYRGTGKESGVEVDTSGAHVWTMREGKAVRLEVFSDRRRALEAAGLGEQTPPAG